MFARLALLVLAALKFGKLGGTLITMLISIGAYALVFGWRYAVGIVAMLFLHEMGHYIAARQRGLKVRPADVHPVRVRVGEAGGRCRTTPRPRPT